MIAGASVSASITSKVFASVTLNVFASVTLNVFASVFAGVSTNIVVDGVGYYQEDVTSNCLPPDLGACKKLRPYMV